VKGRGGDRACKSEKIQCRVKASLSTKRVHSGAKEKKSEKLYVGETISWGRGTSLG